MPIFNAEQQQKLQRRLEQKMQTLWNKLRGELLEDYGMQRDLFTALEVFALRALAIEMANEAAQTKAVKPSKDFTR